MNYLVSIIVPIYNVQQYIHRCLDSIINQTYKNIEIILVDDGSPDRCGEICDEISLKDSRIKVIHKINGGLSDARNVGLDNATGDYICFIDSDDYIEYDYIESMLNKAIKYSADLVVSNFKYVYEDGSYKDYIFNYDDALIDSKKAMDILVSNQEYLPLVVAWSKLYSKNLFDDIRFKKGIIHEDEEIAHKILDKSANILLTNKVLYNYVQRSGSIMSEASVLKSIIICDILEERYNFLLEKEYDEMICKVAFDLKISGTRTCLNRRSKASPVWCSLAPGLAT